VPDLGSSNPHFLVSAIDCWTLISLLSLLIPLFVVCLMSNLVISPQLYTSPTFPQCRKCWPNLCIIFRHTHFDLPIFVWMGYGTDLGSNPKIQALAVWNSFADQHLRVWTCFFEDPKKTWILSLSLTNTIQGHPVTNNLQVIGESWKSPTDRWMTCKLSVIFPPCPIVRNITERNLTQRNIP
jgi:hypothetical protein